MAGVPVTIVGEAFVTGLGVGGGPAPGGPPIGIWPGPGYPAHPIAPGGPPPVVWPGPGVPTHPIMPGGPPPGIWPSPGHPDQGLPPSGVGIWPSPGHPDQGLPPAGIGVWPSPGQPSHPIVLPGPGEGEGGRIEWKAAWSPTTGWVTVGIVTPDMPHPAPAAGP